MEEEWIYTFNLQKDAELKVKRGIGFEDVIYSIQNKKILDIIPHHNMAQYHDQWIMIVEVKGYAYQVPFQYKKHNIHLITVFPSRKCTKKYLGGKDHG